MIKDRQVRQLRKLLAEGETLERAAWKTGMDRKTGRKYRDGKLPSELAEPRTWRTRSDPFRRKGKTVGKGRQSPFIGDYMSASKVRFRLMLIGPAS